MFSKSLFETYVFLKIFKKKLKCLGTFRKYLIFQQQKSFSLEILSNVFKFGSRVEKKPKI